MSPNAQVQPRFFRSEAEAKTSAGTCCYASSPCTSRLFQVYWLSVVSELPE
jgi:hypothetical protein